MPTNEELAAEITRLGEEVRTLKANKADKAAIKAAVDALLAAKAAYKQATGADFVAGAAVPAAGTAQPAQPTDAPKSGDADEAIVDPWTVQGSVDYAKLIEKFGSSAIDQGMIDRMERLTGARISVDRRVAQPPRCSARLEPPRCSARLAWPCRQGRSRTVGYDAAFFSPTET